MIIDVDEDVWPIGLFRPGTVLNHCVLCKETFLSSEHGDNFCASCSIKAMKFSTQRMAMIADVQMNSNAHLRATIIRHERFMSRWRRLAWISVATNFWFMIAHWIHAYHFHHRLPFGL